MAKLVLLAVLLFVFAWGVQSTVGVVRVFFQIAIGAMLAHATTLAHQAMHKQGTGRGKVDSAIGIVLCWMTLYSFFWFRWRHLRHHRLVGSEHDRVSYDFGYHCLSSPNRFVRLGGFALHLLKPLHWFAAARRMGQAVTGRLCGYLRTKYPDLPPIVALQVQREYVVLAVLLSCIVAVSVAAASWAAVDVWLEPLLGVWAPAHAMLELSKHWGCDEESDDPLRNSRSVRAGWFARWLTNHNNAHIGHHYDMRVCVDQLEEFERKLSWEFRAELSTESYPAFFCRFARELWVGPSCSLVSQ